MPQQNEAQARDGIHLVRLDGRGPLNLLGKAVFNGLEAGLDELEHDPAARAVILTGAGDRAFSAGVDLHEMKELAPEDAEDFIRALHRPARKLLTMGLPTIAAIRGPCLGGALELALACDVRIAAADALMGLPEVKVGIPSVIEASLLPRTVGLGRARRLLITGETVDATEALAMGLVDEVVATGDLIEAATETARSLLTIHRDVLAMQKDIVANWLEIGEEAGAEYTIEAFARNFATGVPREYMEAFLEKRPPRL